MPISTPVPGVCDRGIEEPMSVAGRQGGNDLSVWVLPHSDRTRIGIGKGTRRDFVDIDPAQALAIAARLIEIALHATTSATETPTRPNRRGVIGF